MLTGTYGLNMLLDWDESKGYVTQAHQVCFGNRIPERLGIFLIDGNTFSIARQPLVCQGLLIIDAARSHSDTPHLVGLLWTRNQPDAVIYVIAQNTHKRQASMPPVGLETTIPASERP
jgi:hypothetical protein